MEILYWTCSKLFLANPRNALYALWLVWAYIHQQRAVLALNPHQATFPSVVLRRCFQHHMLNSDTLSVSYNHYSATHFVVNTTTILRRISQSASH